MAHCNSCKEWDSLSHCAGCGGDLLARNHYFTGKLLVADDFTIEQDYFIGKDRRHNQYLHGSGTVCGLKVLPHPNPACRGQYLLIRPGVAVDCCGREILVRQDQAFDFRARFLEAWREQHGSEAEPGEEAHALQICIRHVECPSEEVPSFFDDCGCDESASQPNRIEEAYAFELRLDPLPEDDQVEGLRLEWSQTLNVARSLRVAVDEANQRLYVLSGADPGTLYAFDQRNGSLLASQGLPGQASDLALSADGSRVYVSANAAKPVVVLDAAALGTTGAIVNQLPMAGAGSGAVRLAPSPADGRLYVLLEAAAKVFAWDSSIDHAGADLAAANLGQAAVGAAPWGITVAPDGSRVFVANRGDESFSVIDAASLNVATVSTPGIAPYALSVVGTTGGPRLYLADRANPAVYVFSASDPYPALGGPQLLGAQAPVDLAASAGGRWLFTLVDEAGSGSLIMLDGHALEVGRDGLVTRVPVGDAPQELAQAPLSRRLYVAFGGQPGADNRGGVAIIEVLRDACDGLFERALDACPACSQDDCLTLATIEGYVFKADVNEEDIDNLQDRRMLPSVSLLTEAVRCLLDSEPGGGEAGPQGPPGPAGPPGPGIAKLDVAFVACDQPGSFSFEAGVLELNIPSGCAPEQELTHICAINWPHAGSFSPAEFVQDGLVLAFDRQVLAEDIHLHSLRVMTPSPGAENSPFLCWCELKARYIGGVELTLGQDFETGACTIQKIGPHKTSGLVNGACFLPYPNFVEASNGPFRVILEGDQVRGENGRAVDCEHLPKWLPGRPSGSGSEGGRFFSWFGIRVLNLNTAGAEELDELPGIGPELAREIVALRERRGGFNSVDDLLEVPGIGQASLERFRAMLTV